MEYKVDITNGVEDLPTNLSAENLLALVLEEKVIVTHEKNARDILDSEEKE